MLAIGACLLDHSKLDLYKQCATSIYNLCTHMHTRASLNTIHTHAYIMQIFFIIVAQLYTIYAYTCIRELDKFYAHTCIHHAYKNNLFKFLCKYVCVTASMYTVLYL